GCDAVCLESLRLFDARPNFISVESDKLSLAGVVKEIDCLVSLGYNRFQAVEQTEIGGTETPRPAREGRDVAYRFESGSSGAFGLELNRKAWKGRRSMILHYVPILI